MDLDQAQRSGFRCCGCGLTRSVPEVPEGRLRISRRRGFDGPICERCGALAWVRMFSTTEFYAFWNRDDVCRPGEHRAQGVRAYRLVAHGPPGNSDLPRLSNILVRACPEHVPRLREGFAGFILPDGAGPEPEPEPDEG